MASNSLFSFDTDRVDCADINFKNLELLNLVGFDGTEFEPLPTIGYYCEPRNVEYPLNLNQGFSSYIHRDRTDSMLDKMLHYLMQQPRVEGAWPPADFCTNRGTLVDIMTLSSNYHKSFQVVATKFKNCIFLGTPDILPNNTPKVRNTYAFKLRQYLFADRPGGKPNTDEPVNEGRQVYATFGATLGNFKLLYSGEISGVSNSEPLGDLTDPDVLKECRLTAIKVYHGNDRHWRCNYRWLKWISQAHLSGIEEIKVGFYDRSGHIHKEIEAVNCAEMAKRQPWNLKGRLQQLEHFLTKISDAMADVDCPHTAYVFTVQGNSVSLERHLGPNEHSLCDAAFIEFMREW